jgi:hypothetical protein
MVAYFSTPLLPISRPSKQKKIKKEISELIDTTDQMDLTDICKIFHPTLLECTFFFAVHGTIFKTDYILGH